MHHRGRSDRVDAAAALPRRRSWRGAVPSRTNTPDAVDADRFALLYLTLGVRSAHTHARTQVYPNERASASLRLVWVAVGVGVVAYLAQSAVPSAIADMRGPRPPGFHDPHKAELAAFINEHLPAGEAITSDMTVRLLPPLLPSPRARTHTPARTRHGTHARWIGCAA
jgi:hypothetical protein